MIIWQWHWNVFNNSTRTCLLRYHDSDGEKYAALFLFANPFWLVLVNSLESQRKNWNSICGPCTSFAYTMKWPQAFSIVSTYNALISCTTLKYSKEIIFIINPRILRARNARLQEVIIRKCVASPNKEIIWACVIPAYTQTFITKSCPHDNFRRSRPKLFQGLSAGKGRGVLV